MLPGLLAGGSLCPLVCLDPLVEVLLIHLDPPVEVHLVFLEVVLQVPLVTEDPKAHPDSH